MGWVNDMMLWGLALIAVPIVLHFLMRAKPKRLIFPALRFIQQHRKSSIRRLRLRHIALLILRALVIALIVFLVARPEVPVADYGLSAYESLMLFVLLAAAVGGYFLTMHRMRNQKLHAHQFLTRRTYLRAGIIGGAILLILLLVGWPYASRIAAEYDQPVADNAPIAAVFVMDTSLSMDLFQDNATRLEKAKRIAKAHLATLKVRSKIAVTSTERTDAGESLFFQGDRASAHTRINDLKIHADATTLSQQVLAAIRLHRDDRGDVLDNQSDRSESDRRDQFVREIYVFTDLARTAWKLDASIRKRLAELPGVNVYVVDVGGKDPADLSLAPLEVPSVARRNMPIKVQAKVVGTGAVPTTRVTIKCSFFDLNGHLIEEAESQQIIPIAGEKSLEPFVLSDEGWKKVRGDFIQGKISIVHDDTLPANNSQYFSIQVQSRPKVLVVSESDFEATYLANALAPKVLGRNAPFEVQVIGPGEIAGRKLETYRVVCLVNLVSPAEEGWQALAQYAETGGALVVFLGRKDLRLPAYNNDAARRVLPIEKLAGLLVWPETAPEYFNVVKAEHPIFGYFKEQQMLGGFTGVDILRFWSVKPHPNAEVLAYFTSPRGSRVYPAFLERKVEAGNVMLLATGVDRKRFRFRRENFTDLPIEHGVFLVFVHRMMSYLIAPSYRVANVEAGTRPFIPAGSDGRIREFDLIKPNLETQRNVAVEDKQHFLPLPKLEAIGNYQIKQRPALSDGAAVSVNQPQAESDFTKLTESQLDELFGEDRYQTASDIESLDRIAGKGFTQEIPGVVIAILLAFFAIECLVANRFYEESVKR